MNITLTVLSQVTIMFLLIGVGLYCYRKEILNEETAGQLSEILLMIITPAVIIRAFQIEFNPSLAKGLVVSCVLAVLSHLTGILISVLLVRKQKGKKEYKVERFACVYGNASFMGIPLIASVLPENGVFFASAYIAVFNIFIWTHGVTLISGKFSPKELLKVLKSPPIIGVFLGLIMFFASFRLPHVIGSSISFIADLNTPLAMLVTGIYIAKSKLLTAFTDLKIYKVALSRLLFIPAIMILLLMFVSVTTDLKPVFIANILASACPTAATTLLIATKFRAGPEHASRIIAATTVFSVITIPLIMLMMDKLIGKFPVINF